MARARAAWSLGAVALLALGAVGPVTAQSARLEVRAVHFVGNRAFPDDSLARAIVTRATECRSTILLPFCLAGADFAVKRFTFRPRVLPADRLRLLIWYQQRGFLETQVDTATAPRGGGTIEVTFRIVEGRPVLVRSIRVEGIDELNIPDLAEDLPIRPGHRLSRFRLDAARDTLQHRLANRGYAHAVVLRRHVIPADSPYVADVTFDVDAGPLARYGPIEIVGNRHLSDETIRNTLQFREGELYRRDQLILAQARLFGLEIVRSASVEELRGSETDTIIPIRVRIAEGDAYRVRYGAGLNDAECFDAEARWTARSFFGGGRTLRLRARLSNIGTPQFRDLLCPDGGRDDFADLTGIVSAEFAQPWIFSTRNSFTASVFGERQSLPDVFVREAVGSQFALTRALSPQTPLTLSYRPEFSRLVAADLLFCTGFLVCTPEDIRTLSGTSRLAPVGINLSRNVSDNVLNPRDGYSVVLDFEHAAGWTGSEYRYDRVAAEGSVYQEVLPGFVIAGRLRTGWVGSASFGGLVDGDVELIHPQKRFFAGGANSVRGFAQSRLGPRVLQLLDPTPLLSASGAGCTPEEVVARVCDANPLPDGSFLPRPTGGTRVLEGSIEFRIGLGGPFEGAVFTDAGQVWGVGESASLTDLVFTPGVGVRYLSPIGPIRVDLAYRARGAEDLRVVTTQIRPFDPQRDDEADRLQVDGAAIPWVRTQELALLEPRVRFGASDRFALSRFQLHISIGQAF